MSFYRFGRALVKPFTFFFHRVTVIGAENEPDTPYILCANHSSYSDPLIAGCAVRSTIRFVARSSLSRFAFFKFLFKHVRVITVNRDGTDRASLRAIVSAAQNGECIGIFPQGTRMRRVEPKPEQAMAGLGLIASLTKIPVLPVSIITKRRMPGFFRKTYALIGKPIMPEEYLPADIGKKKDLSEYLFARVCEPFSIPFDEMRHYDKDR